MLMSNESFESLGRRYDPGDWIPRSMALELDLQRQDLEREYEAREAFHVAGRDETIRQLESRRAFARYALLRAASWKAASEFRRVDQRNGGRATQVQGALRRTLGTARKPVVFTAERQGLRYGSSINLLEQNGKVWAHSTLVNGAVEYQGVRPPLPQILRRELEAFVTNERWTFQLWRPVPLLGDTEVRATYGTTSARFKFSVTRQITAHLHAAYELTTEHVIKVQYGVRI